MTNLRKELEKCKHPNSRKTKALSKKARRQNNKHKARLGHAIKSNLMGEKLSWFVGHIDEQRSTPLTPQEFEDLIALYLRRFNEELEQIALKQSISKNRSKQHAARQDVIRITLEKERNEYQTGGMELLNLCDPVKFKSLMEWDGNALRVQHLKLDLVSHSMLQRLKQTTEPTATNADNEQSTSLPSTSSGLIPTSSVRVNQSECLNFEEVKASTSVPLMDFTTSMENSYGIERTDICRTIFISK